MLNLSHNFTGFRETYYELIQNLYINNATKSGVLSAVPKKPTIL